MLPAEIGSENPAGRMPVRCGFHPNSFPSERPAPGDGGPVGGADPLAQALLRDLELGEQSPRPWGACMSLLVGVFSLGALPVLLWHDRFRDFVEDERHRLRRFADWLRLRSSRPETMDLRVSADDLGTRPLLSTLSILSVIALIVLFATQVTGTRPLIQQLVGFTYRFNYHREWVAPLTDGQRLFAAWSIGLSVAYLFHWLQVRAHTSDIRRFVGHANKVLLHAGVQPVPAPRRGLWLGFLWVFAGAFLASKGAWWGFALALSGASQQRYMCTDSLRLRRALAGGVRLRAYLPGATTPGARTTAQSDNRCPHVRCLAPVPNGARFCPRCGHRMQPDGTEMV
jgi:hypothetical protein